jgi:hypothetical protein
MIKEVVEEVKKEGKVCHQDLNRAASESPKMKSYHQELNRAASTSPRQEKRV